MEAKDTFFSKKQSLNVRGKLVFLSRPVVMGIVNITADSFYEGSRFTGDMEILKRCEQILSEGGTFIDLGAYSSRPGAEDISEAEEIKKLANALKIIRKEFPDALISVDTFRSGVARTVVNDFEADMINDISGGNMDEQMFETVASLKVPYILMHMRGTPQTMQQQTTYENMEAEILQYFSEKILQLKTSGVKDIILDPGFGFAKTLEQNYRLLGQLPRFTIFGLPLLVGLSRKSMIYRLLKTSPADALNGTTALNTIALLGGADILRVHDVKEAVECIQLVETYKQYVKLSD